MKKVPFGGAWRLGDISLKGLPLGPWLSVVLYTGSIPGQWKRCCFFKREGCHFLGSFCALNRSQTWALESHTLIFTSPGQSYSSRQIPMWFNFPSQESRGPEMFLSGKTNSLDLDVISSFGIPLTFWPCNLQVCPKCEREVKTPMFRVRMKG